MDQKLLVCIECFFFHSTIKAQPIAKQERNHWMNEWKEKDAANSQQILTYILKWGRGEQWNSREEKGNPNILFSSPSKPKSNPRWNPIIRKIERLREQKNLEDGDASEIQASGDAETRVSCSYEPHRPPPSPLDRPTHAPQPNLNHQQPRSHSLAQPPVA